jgi:2-polyprenyl-3-methyl-5-hydroxy-6-metoxy-1,4-benzoquinol methylase
MHTSNSFYCKICSNTTNNKFHQVKEMMFGFRDSFTYFECNACGCLQLVNPPNNLSKYYPSQQYYSFNTLTDNAIRRVLKKYLLKRLLKYYLGQYTIIGKILSTHYEYARKYAWVKYIKNISFNARVLDIGSGSGKYLLELYQVGFKNITGIDPYNTKIIQLNKDVTIFNYDISQVKDKYDFIILNHSLEHMEDQDFIFKQLKRVLNMNGKILIRIPITGGEAWKKYGVYWYQIDAPRHFFIHSLSSFIHLITQHGFQIDSFQFDSNDYQFKFSEQYQQNLTLFDDGNFTKEVYQKWREKAQDLNKNETGDQASFIIKYL